VEECRGYTNCGWTYSYVKSSNPKAPVKITIQTIFNENQSWKDVKRINDYVLLHEQKHFDVAVFARKLRKEVSEKIKNGADFDRYFKTIYNTILKEYQDFQKTYDGETRNGMVEESRQNTTVLLRNNWKITKNYKTS
jgi:hypothetical protein